MQAITNEEEGVVKKPASRIVSIKTVAICELWWIMNDTLMSLQEQRMKM
jgi:hypothetical protein